jgi:acetyl esterase/lipase
VTTPEGRFSLRPIPRPKSKWVARLARAANVRGLAIDSRLAPEHGFPAVLEDATAGYRWLLTQG